MQNIPYNTNAKRWIEITKTRTHYEKWLKEIGDWTYKDELSKNIIEYYEDKWKKGEEK